MWFFNLNNQISLKCCNQNKIILIYNPVLTIFINFKILKTYKKYFFINKYLLIKNILKFTIEHTIVKIKYIGKIFRIKKKKKIFFLQLNFSHKHFLIKKNIKVKFFKKKKNFFFLLTQ